MMMKVMSVVSQSWTVKSIFCVTHVHSIKGAMNFTTDSLTLPSVTLHVSNPFANRMQMAGIMPHDHIGKTLQGFGTRRKKKKKKKLLLLVFQCLQTKRSSSSLGPQETNPRCDCICKLRALSQNLFYLSFLFWVFCSNCSVRSPDSMALCILTARWWQQQQQVKRLSHSVIKEAAGGMMLLLLSNHAVGMVVDHGLHPKSLVEALSVQHWLATSSSSSIHHHHLLHTHFVN